jgi:tetracycline repressor-like protein
VPPIAVCPDTGSWRSDLVEVVHSQIDLLRTYGPVIERSIETTQTAEEYASMARAVAHRRLTRYQPMFERAIARGELDPTLDFESSVDLLFGQVYVRFLEGRPAGHQDAEAIVDLALSGLTADHERP